jgi:hypothetical protein
MTTSTGEPVASTTVQAETPAPAAVRRPQILVWTGRFLSSCGSLSLPLGLGAILGFYAADQGMRWLPSMLELVLLVFVIGFLALPLGRVLQGEAYRETPRKRRLRRRIVFCLVLAAAGAGARLGVYWMQAPTALTCLPEGTFNATFATDSQRYREFDHALEEAISFLERQEHVFHAQEPEVLSANQEKTLLDAWASIYDLSFALDQIRIFYEDWYRFDPSRAQRSLHLRSYLLTYAAELALYEKSTRLVRLITRNPNAVKFLDCPHPSLNLPADSFSRYREELQGNRDRARVVAGEQYLRWLAAGLHARAEAAGLGCDWLWDATQKHLAVIRGIDTGELNALTWDSDMEVIKREVRRHWYPAQASVAEWMGDTRVRRAGRYLITAEQITDMLPHLAPGDLLLSRKNWYLSNVGLPGFWPHAILYIGSPEEFHACFEKPEVRAWVRAQSGRNESLEEWLQRRWPSQWLQFQAGEEDEPFRVIEGISEGVVLNTLPHACGDYLAALRPRLDVVAKAQAIAEAFGHLGKPYDYNFDFATDHALVCTELVWRSYRPAAGKAGLVFPLQEICGRRTLPANTIAATFAVEHGQPEAQMDFVYFLDASETLGRACPTSETEFLISSRRTKWDLSLK